MKKLAIVISLSVSFILPGCLSTKTTSGQIGVIPETALVGAGSIQQFTPALTGNLAAAGVTWSISGTGCSAGSCGTVDSSGSYKAPSAIPANPVVQVVATAKADATKSASAVVTIDQAITLSVSPPSPQTVPASQTLQLTPTVSNTSNTTVNWTVTGTGCTGNACGTITTPTTAGAAATYTAPNLLPSAATVTITATSAADSTKSVPVDVNLISDVTTSPSGNITVPVLQSRSFTATVIGPPANQTGVTWSLSGPACSGATCGTLSNVTANSVTYTAPASQPSTPTATLTATAQFDGANSTPVTITIAALNQTVPEARLFGRYAFVYRGYPNINGTPVVESGSLVFNGAGGVTGVEDDNNGTTVHTQVSVSGSYTIQEADGRGSITLSTGLVTTLQIVVLSTSDSTVASAAYLTDFGGTVVGAGRMELQQDPSTLTLGSLAGGYAVSFRGASMPAAVGRFDISGPGSISNVEVGRIFADSSFGTCPSPTISPSSTYTLSSGAYGPINTTTGQANFSFQSAQIGNTTGQNLTFSGYVVSPSKVLLVETDTSGFTFLGSAELQSSSSFTNADFSGINAYHFQASNGTGTGNTSQGSLVSLGTGSFDEIEYFGNTDGLIPVPGTFQDASGAYAIQSNGTGLSNFCSAVNGSNVQTVPTSHLVLYLASGLKMFAWNMDGEGSFPITNTLGEIDRQQGGPFSATSLSALSGTFAFGVEGVDGTFTGGHTATQAVAESGIVSFNGNGTATFTFDVIEGSTKTTGFSVTATYALDNDLDGNGDTEGYGSFTITNTSNGTTTAPFSFPDHFVIVTTGKIFLMHQGSDSNVGGVAETQ